MITRDAICDHCDKDLSIGGVGDLAEVYWCGDCIKADLKLLKDAGVQITSSFTGQEALISFFGAYPFSNSDTQKLKAITKKGSMITYIRACNHCDTIINVNNQNGLYWCNDCMENESDLLRAIKFPVELVPGFKGSYIFSSKDADRLKSVPKKIKKNKELTQSDALIIVMGAMIENYLLAHMFSKTVSYKDRTLIKGTSVTAYKLTSKHQSDFKIRHVYDDIYLTPNVKDAAEEFILLVGMKDSIKSVSKAVKLRPEHNHHRIFAH